MKTSIYISNDAIQVIAYEKAANEILVKQYMHEPIPERTVFNGVITDAAALSAAITHMADENRAIFKSATLTVDTNAILTKRIQVPKLKRDQYMNVVVQEIGANASSYENLLYAYALFPEDNGQYMLGCAVDKPVIENYISVFKDANIALDSIHVGLELIIQYVRKTPALCAGTIAVCLLDDVSLLSMIFTDGQYLFSTRARIVGDEKTEIAREMMSSLNSLLQFDASITQAHYMGIDSELLYMIQEIESENIEVQILPLNLRENCQDSEEIGTDCHFAILGTLKSDHSIDFAKIFKKDGSFKIPKFKPWHIVLAAILVIIGSFYGSIMYNVHKNNVEIASITEFLQNPENIAQLEAFNQTEAKIERLSQVNRQMEEANRLIAVYPAISREMVDWLFGRAGNVQIQKLVFDSTARTLKLTYNCASEYASSGYVAQIKDFPEFESVVYTGYSAESETAFAFEITITLKEKDVGESASAPDAVLPEYIQPEEFMPEEELAPEEFLEDIPIEMGPEDAPVEEMPEDAPVEEMPEDAPVEEMPEDAPV